MTRGRPVLFVADADALLRRLSPNIDVSMLIDISRADYGRKADECLLMLRRMRSEGIVPHADDHATIEVLELVRWSEPDRPEWAPGGHGLRGHWMRAFASTWLLRFAAEHDFRWLFSFNETVIGLVASIEALGKSFWSETGALLEWFLDRAHVAGYDDEDAFLGVALLWCALRTDIADDLIIALCRWISDREAAAVAEHTDPAERWLERTTPHDGRRETWRRFGADLLALDMRGRSPDAQEWITLIGTALCDG